MPKRRTYNDDPYASEDNPIGLTGAFAPVKGPQSVDYDAAAGDNPVGLTQAFGAIPDEEREPAWNGSEKWKGFDWNAPTDDSMYDDGRDAQGSPAESDAQTVDSAGAGAAYGDAAEGAQRSRRTVDAGVGAAGAGAGAAAAASAGAAAAGAATVAAPKSDVKRSGRGRHAAPVKELSPKMKKSQRTRRVLTVLLIILIIVIAAVIFFWYRTWTGSHQEAAQQTQEQAATPNQREGIADTPARDATESTAKLADVPDLSGILGKSQDEAIQLIGRGALITANNPVNEEGNPIKTNLNVALTDEPADSKTGTPTVYLGLGEDGTVQQAGYSASASALGFGSLSFADAVNNEHAVEKTLARIGVPVEEGTVALPANKDEYSTYNSDGTTVIRERCSFEGEATVAGIPCFWSSVLSYDYTTQVVTGNLNDTVRVIYAYITTANAQYTPPPAEEAPAPAEEPPAEEPPAE